MSELKLKDCCISISDGDHLPPPKVNNGIPFITISNIDSSNHIDFKNTLFVPEEYYENLNNIRKPIINDILYSVVGSFGKAVLVKENKKFVFQRHIAILRPNSDIVNPIYLYYIMSSKSFYNKADVVAIGAAQRTISLTSLRNLKISLPTIDIQNRIAEILSRYDSLIENYQKQIKLLEESAQRLYKEWFVDLRFPGHENTKIVDGVPEGWEKKEINEFISILSGYAFKSSSFVEDGDYKIVTIKNVQDGFFDGKNLSHIREIPNKIPKHCFLTTGDLLLSLTGNIGRVCMVMGNNYLLNQRVAKIESVFPAFAYCLFRSENMFTSINNLANGAAQQNVSPIKIGTLGIVVNNEIIFKFEKIVGNIRNQILVLYSQIEELTEARDRLLPKLIDSDFFYLKTSNYGK